MPTKKTKKKDVVVDRKFLTDLANSIYNPKTRHFLRLCNGTLQNGPDPTNPKRPMHCGLGELYFAMTGRQPEADRVNEGTVIDLAFENSPLAGRQDAIRRGALRQVKELNVPANVKQALLSAVEEMDDDLYPAAEEFKAALSKVIDENDSDDDDGRRVKPCSYETYRRRSQRVARQFRKAAKLLPA